MTLATAEPLIWGSIGGLLGNLLLLVRHAKLPSADRPRLVSDPWFWAGWLIEAFLGLVLSLAYLRTGVRLPPLVAINIGASAPLIVEKLLSGVQSITKSG